jgi:hypothetical protein
VSENGDIRLHRFELDEYHRLIEAGGFDEVSRLRP